MAISELMVQQPLQPTANSADSASRYACESMMQLYKDIVMEHGVPTPLMVAQVNGGEKQCHLIYDA